MFAWFERLLDRLGAGESGEESAGDPVEIDEQTLSWFRGAREGRPPGRASCAGGSRALHLAGTTLGEAPDGPPHREHASALYSRSGLVVAARLGLGGRRASARALCDGLHEALGSYAAEPGRMRDRLEASFHLLNLSSLDPGPTELPPDYGAGMAACWLEGERLACAQIGRVGLWWWRDGEWLERLGPDARVEQILMATVNPRPGTPPEVFEQMMEDAREESIVATRALGIAERVDIAACERELRAGDRLLLAGPELLELEGADEILSTDGDAGELLERLLRRLASSAGRDEPPRPALVVAVEAPGDGHSDDEAGGPTP